MTYKKDMPEDRLTEELEKEVDERVRAELGNDGYIGYCHCFWAAKKRILKEEYGIDWITPAERYPGIIFD